MVRVFEKIASYWWLPILIYTAIFIGFLSLEAYYAPKIFMKIVGAILIISIALIVYSWIHLGRVKKSSGIAPSVVSFIVTTIFFLFGWLAIFFGKAFDPANNYVVFSEQDYINSFSRETGVDPPTEFNFIAKDDTIYLIGFEGDYSIRCMFEVSGTERKRIRNQLSNDSRFERRTENLEEFNEIMKFVDNSVDIPKFSEVFYYSVPDMEGKNISIGFARNKNVIAFEVFKW